MPRAPGEIEKEPELARRVIRPGAALIKISPVSKRLRDFLFPSTSEGFGLPVLEAMQCGAPVICSNSSSLPEVAGDAAILVDSSDQVALAEAIVRLLTNPALRRELMTLSIRQAGRFSWEFSAEKVVEAYRMAVNPLGIT